MPYSTYDSPVMSLVFTTLTDSIPIATLEAAAVATFVLKMVETGHRMLCDQVL